MPFIASWKGHVPFASACEEPVVGYDLFPTILSMTGSRSDALVDGVSLARVNGVDEKQPVQTQFLHRRLRDEHVPEMHRIK